LYGKFDDFCLEERLFWSTFERLSQTIVGADGAEGMRQM
jgi:hypothetical protein